MKNYQIYKNFKKLVLKVKLLVRINQDMMKKKQKFNIIINHYQNNQVNFYKIKYKIKKIKKN